MWNQNLLTFKLREKWVNGLGFFAPIFSRWTGLKFVEIYEKKKIEKLKKLSFGCHFGRKRRGKAGEISVKFENLEKKKWANGLGFFL